MSVHGKAKPGTLLTARQVYASIKKPIHTPYLNNGAIRFDGGYCPVAYAVKIRRKEEITNSAARAQLVDRDSILIDAADLSVYWLRHRSSPVGDATQRAIRMRRTMFRILGFPKSEL